MSDILSHLLESENFDLILEEYELSKYELLSSIREEVIRHPEKFSPDEKEQLKGFYLSNYSMIDLHSEPVIFISDTHYASKNENLIYTSLVMDYCRRNNIQTLFHGGDIGDGMVQYSSKYFSVVKQIEHIVDVYPEDKRIKQYAVGGNHDLKYRKNGINLLKLLASEKKNFFPMGYSQAYFTIYGIPISFEHHCRIHACNRLVDSPLSIMGHAHKSRFTDRIIKLPTLSDDRHANNIDTLPGFVTMQAVLGEETVNLCFKRYFIENYQIEEDKPYIYQLKK